MILIHFILSRISSLFLRGFNAKGVSRNLCNAERILNAFVISTRYPLKSIVLIQNLFLILSTRPLYFDKINTRYNFSISFV